MTTAVSKLRQAGSLVLPGVHVMHTQAVLPDDPINLAPG